MFGQLADCQSVVIWKLHLDDVENIPMISIDTVCRAYETALDHIGEAWDSGTIWDEYIRLLKAQPTTHTWTIMLKITRLRSVYHRVVEIPLDNIGERWSALREFEDLYDAPNAEETIASLRPAYQKARTTLHQLMKLTSLLGLSHINGLDLPKQPIFSDQERQMVGYWKQYIRWEQENPLGLDNEKLLSRLRVVHRRAILSMRYYAEIWYVRLRSILISNVTPAQVYGLRLVRDRW